MPTISDIRKQYPQYDDMSDEQLAVKLHQKFYSDMPFTDFAQRIGFQAADPTEGMSWLDKALAGAGKFFVDTARGAEQAVRGMVPGESDREKQLNQEIQESRRLDQPLLRTGAGRAGNIVGALAAGAPAMLVPGANTVAGGAAVGALMGATQPTVEGESRLLNMAVGGGLGAGGQYLGQKAGQALGRVVQNRQARKAMDAPKNAIVQKARERGYSIPPSQTKPSFVNNRLTGFAGKASTQQGASIRNQEVTNRLTRQALGLPDDAPITPDVLANIRQNAGKMYDEMKQLGTVQVDKNFDQALDALTRDYKSIAQQFPTQAVKRVDDLLDDVDRESFDADNVVELVKRLRFQARKNMRSFDDPDKAALGKIQKGVANELENLMERRATAQGADDLVQRFREARQQIAKSYSVEDALDEGTGNIDARSLAKQLSKDAPLSGELREIAEFAQTFPKANQLMNEVSTGGSPLDAALAIGSSVGTGNPAYMGIMAARPGMRKLVTSPAYQKIMATPRYGTAVPRTGQRLLQSRPGQALSRTAGPAVVLTDKEKGR